MLKKAYNAIRSSLPPPAKVGVSKLVFRLANKPFYVGTDRIDLERGVIVLSCDFELAWAWRYSKRKINPLEMARQERKNFPIILQKLTELDIPITWATVGHLFLESCKRDGGRANSDLLRPEFFENEFWNYERGDWYDIDPCGSYKTHPEYYAPDLVEMILNSKVPHEIGCHSFSHCDFS